MDIALQDFRKSYAQASSYYTQNHGVGLFLFGDVL